MPSTAGFPVLIVGYGNLDREDDGVDRHILTHLAARLGKPFAAAPEDYEFNPGQDVDFFFTLQLFPELAETLSRYARVCFVDAHTGAVAEDVHLELLSAQMQSSPFTHHLTAATLLSLTTALYPHTPLALLASVRGFNFGFAQQLSPATAHFADQAVEQIMNWLEKS
jgi:hydrogenase maturation protease